MNTTAAAAEAHVTVTTIRHWARRGVIAATKTAGKWVINAASLARRITIGALKRRTPREEAVMSPEPTTDRTDRKAARAANKSLAAEARARVLAAVLPEMPELAGTEKQISWATDIRTRRIEAAIENLRGSHLGIHYCLASIDGDPLRAGDIPGLRSWNSEDDQPTEAALLQAIITAATHKGSGTRRDDRTQAAWWIDLR
ncbi:hypothetical protein [Streptomyces goshikiensis]|uniref:hypothetical protein n=1 Tax=Streptomyces goshikiensis TaxID=1942 RepID=UPI00369647DF